MKQDGQFILFESKEELKNWLFAQNVKRTIKTIDNHHTAVPAYSNFTGNNHFTLQNRCRDTMSRITDGRILHNISPLSLMEQQ